MANTVLLEARPYRPFKSSEEYLYAMREDLAEWMNLMYPELMINTENFMDRLDTGVTLCKHANNVRKAAEEYLARRHARNKSMTKSVTSGLAGPILAIGNIHYLPAAKSGTFFARDNVSNFISWCRKSLQIFECLLFETDDLIMRKNEKHVILCLLEVARRGAKFGMLAPMLVQMERQIDREIAADNRANGVGCGTQTDSGLNSMSTETDLFEDSDTENEEEDSEPMLMYGPQPQIITNDLKSLDEMVRDLVEKCTCPSQFPMVRVSEGKYRIGDTKVLIFVRILRSHVMVRVGGGWDTLSHYLDKHDPCRCRAQHRSSVAARLITRTTNSNNGIELHKAQVHYERSPPTLRKGANGHQNNNTPTTTLSPPAQRGSRSRSSTPQRRIADAAALEPTIGIPELLQEKSTNSIQRPTSPNPLHLSETKKKQLTNESSNSSTSVHPIEAAIQVLNELKTDLSSADGKFENISDNGSEISDEGYRSLGIIQANNNNNNSIAYAMQIKRASLNSQTSTEDAELNVRLDQTSSDSQISPTDDQNPTLIDQNSSNDETVDANLPDDQQQSKLFEQSGVYITDDDITIDIATTTGLRKTDFSSNLYGDDPSIPSTTNNKQTNGGSKIPRSPMPARRKSIDNGTAVGRTPDKGSPIQRKVTAYRSVRKPAPVSKDLTKDTTAKDTSTWSGRTSTKKRPSLASDTFQTPSTNGNGLNRNSPVRSSQTLYDKNGRRIKSTNSSPTKIATSPLAQQILEAAGHAKSDAQMLEKMKRLLSKYTKTKSDDLNNRDYDDFTTAWVNSNGKVDRTSTSFSPSPTKMQSKRSSAASSIESNHSRDIPTAPVPRRERGLSKIPAPIRQNTELY